MLIIFSGLPGTGKTTIAKKLSLRIGATYIRIDTIEQAIIKSDIGSTTAEDAGYLVGYALAEDNLKLGRTVIADSVNPIELSRTAWLNVAKNSGQRSFEIEVVCSNPEVHRMRVETRNSDIEGLVPPSWQSVMNHEYHDWNRDRIEIDTAAKSPQQSIDELISRLPRM